MTYALDATSERVFAIVETSGQLRTKAALDHETTSSYTVTVTATDLLGASTSIDVTIDVTDVDEPPTLMGPANIPYEENDTGIVHSFSATDPEEEPITWELTGTDRNALTLSGARLRVGQPLHRNRGSLRWEPYRCQNPYRAAVRHRPYHQRERGAGNHRAGRH